MRETAASSVEAAGLYRTFGIPVVEGLAAFHHDAYAEAVEPFRFMADRRPRNATSWTAP
jgi:hypothetical protein